MDKEKNLLIPDTLIRFDDEQFVDKDMSFVAKREQLKKTWDAVNFSKLNECFYVRMNKF